MRLAYLCADRGIPIDGTKGASIHVRGVVRALRGRGHDLTLLAAQPGAAAAAGVGEVVDVGFDRTVKELKRAAAGAGGDRQLGREVQGLLLNLRVAEALDDLDRRQPLDAVYERYSLWSWAGLRFARRRGVPLVLEVNAPLVAETSTWRRLELAPVARAVEGRLLRGADAVIVPSGELADWVESAGRRGRPTWVIPNGFDEAVFRRPGPLPGAAARFGGRYVVAFVGTLKPWHGVEVLLAAFESLLREVPQAHLLVVGDGPLRPALEEARERLGEENVTVTGAVEHARVPAWLACADVGVAPYPELPSFYFSPLKVVEYQAAGLPVVASRCGQLRELVQDGRTGRLVPPGDAAALAAALRELHGAPDRRRRWGRRGRRRAFRKSSWGGVAEQTEAVIERCRERRAGGRPAATGAA